MSLEKDDKIALPESLYAEAAKAAQLQGVSLELFVSEAVQSYMDYHSHQVELSESQVEAIRRSQEELKAGQGLTMGELRENLDRKKQAWLQNSKR